MTLTIKNFCSKMHRQLNLAFINLKFEPKSFVSLPKNSKDATFEEENKKNFNDQIFSVTYDSGDGCYSIVNLESMNCLSSFNGSKEKSFVSQNYFFGVDFQRWIIGTYQSKNSDYFIELKSNLLRLGVGEKINFQFVPLVLEKFDKNHHLKNKQIFNFKPSKYMNFNEIKKYQGLVEEGTKFRYKKKFNLPMKFKYDKWVVFVKLSFLTKLQIPISVQRIPEKAFIDLKRIKIIDCDPKWIKLFPNPLNIENVIVPQGVEVIEDDSFKDLQNLKVLSLPASLKIEYFDPSVFKVFYDLRRFEGNPIFLKYIHKSSLELVFIPSWVEEIPEEAFIGCKYLAEIKMEDNSKMKKIKARAFANCHSLQSLKVPESVINIAPSAFNGCNDLFKPELTNEQQRFSLVESLVIEPELIKITENYKKFCNIQSLEIPLTTEECDPNVLNSFKHLSFVKCNPKWFNSFITENIQAVFIPEGISQIDKNDFANLIHLKYLEIPTSVELIEENTFSTCNELTSVKCRIKHLQFLNQKQIKELILNDVVTKIYRNNFERFINLESIELPDSIEYIGPNAFIHCKKLVNVNNELAEKLINNRVSINDSQKVIIKDEFEGWTNLQFLEIPNSVEEIEEGTFDECINLEHIKCDPKWFNFMPKNSIREITVPDFVEELNSGEFDGFYSLTKLELPKNIIINDPNIFDSCESLIIINCENSLFKRLSKKTRKRCTERKVLKYVKPVYDFQPDKTKVHDEKVNLSKNSRNDDDVQEYKYKPAKEIDFDDLIKSDERFEQYRIFIDNVYRLWNLYIF